MRYKRIASLRKSEVCASPYAGKRGTGGEASLIAMMEVPVFMNSNIAIDF